MFSTLISLLFGFNAILFAHAEIWVTKPACGSTCHAGQNCTISWLPGGSAPLLEDIGECSIGLYTGKMNLVQPIATFNVAFKHSITFIPNPQCGSNRDDYYIVFKSSFQYPNCSTHMDFSPFFSLEGMTGSADSAECRSRPFLTLAAPSPGDIPTTTVGTLATPAMTTHYSYPTSTQPSNSNASQTTSANSSSSDVESLQSAGIGIFEEARGGSLTAALVLFGFALVL